MSDDRRYARQICTEKRHEFPMVWRSGQPDEPPGEFGRPYRRWQGKLQGADVKLQRCKDCSEAHDAVAVEGRMEA